MKPITPSRYAMLTPMIGLPMSTEFCTMNETLYRRSWVPPCRNPPPENISKLLGETEIPWVYRESRLPLAGSHSHNLLGGRH